MTDYRDRIDRVRAAIRADLAAPLDLDALAEVACLSRFHFARVFRATTGETPAEAVRRARLNRAAVLLVATDEPVDRIAALCGFGHPGSFERAFGRAFGRTPTQMRAGGVVPAPLLPRERGEIPMFDVAVREEPEEVVAALAHQGAYSEIGSTFEALWAAVAESGLETSEAMALYYDDPSAVPVEELRAHAGFVVPSGGRVPGTLARLVLPAGRVAVLTYRGPYSGLPTPWAHLYGEWLPRSGETPADRAPYERYLDAPGSVPEAEQRTEIVVPLSPPR